MRPWLILALALSIACGFARQQVHVSAAQSCINANCKAFEARAYQQCEAACQERYGK